MYMAPGSADCQYAIRELTTGIKELKVADMQGGTCKAPNPQRISKLEEAQNIWSILECYSDTPWGNCKRRRKPTACGGSKISTCVFGLIDGLFYHCTTVRPTIWILGDVNQDASPFGFKCGKRSFQRQAAGRVRHLEVKSLWVQQVLRQKKFSLAVRANGNVADDGMEALPDQLQSWRISEER